MLESPLHEHHLLRFHVEFQDKPFHGRNQCAEVSFFDENDKKVAVHRFGVVSKEELYLKIEREEELLLDGCYVLNFSLSEYRTLHGLEEHASVKLKGWHAQRAFFDCDVTTDFSYAEFEGDQAIFESAIFGNGRTNFANANFNHGKVSFKRTKFGSGSTSFQSVKFGDGAVTFNNTNFGTGDLNFVDVDFSSGDVDFKNTYFGDGNVDFKFAKFSKGDITFERASFGKGRKDFKNVEFGGGRIDFRRIEFNNGDVSFEGVEFGDGRVTFRNSVFGIGHKSFEQADFGKGNAHFDQVDFGTGSLSFNRAKADEISFHGCPLNCYTDFRFGQCAMADLTNTIVRDILDVKPENENVVIQAMNFVDMRILGRIFIDWRGNNVFDLIYNQKKTTLFQKAEQFRILKENFRNNGQYEDEDGAYLEFKRCESKASLEEGLKAGPRAALKAWPQYYFQKYVFDFIGRYATAPTRVLANALLAVTLFSLIYYAGTTYSPHGLGAVVSTLPPELNHEYEFWNSLYYSFITFFTIGYGDYIPVGYLKAVAAFEGFTGVFLMSYFTVAFVRKILR
ncbi:MAG: potassium channel family protein [Bacteroidia bacterium]